MKTLERDLQAKTFQNVYLIYGEEEYLKLHYKQQFIRVIVGDNTMNLVQYEGKNIDIGELIDNADTAPFFAEHRLIVVENSGFLKGGGDALAEYLKEIPDSTILLFVEQEVDKRSKLFKAVKNAGYVCEIGRQSENELVRWAAKIFEHYGKKITRASLSYLIANVGTDMEILSREIEKLISHTLYREEVTNKDMDAVCTKQLSVRIFDMIDAISIKNQRKTMDCYYELIAEKEPPMRILFMLERQFHLMLQAKDLSAAHMDKSRIAKVMGVQDFIAGKCINQSRNFSVTELKSALAESVKTDEMIKSGMLDENIGVEMLLIKYSAKSNENLKRA